MILNPNGTIEINKITFKITEISPEELTLRAISGRFSGQIIKIPNTGRGESYSDSQLSTARKRAGIES
jgi:hypothetical protein